MIPLYENCENWFGHNPAWRMDIDADENYPFIYLYDLTGFFTHISLEMWMDEVILGLPENFTTKELDARARLFMLKYRHLYVCNN